MSQSAPTSWQDEIRSREEEARLAFLNADLPALDKLFTDAFAVNSPLQKVFLKQQLFEALKSGRIRHLACESHIEHISRHGDLVVVMGHDHVVDPPDNALSHRRFTNIWVLEHDHWRMLARHAHVISRETPATPP